MRWLNLTAVDSLNRTTTTPTSTWPWPSSFPRKRSGENLGCMPQPAALPPVGKRRKVQKLGGTAPVCPASALHDGAGRAEIAWREGAACARWESQKVMHCKARLWRRSAMLYLFRRSQHPGRRAARKSVHVGSAWWHAPYTRVCTEVQLHMIDNRGAPSLSLEPPEARGWSLICICAGKAVSRCWQW